MSLDSLQKLRTTTSRLLAAAVLDLCKGAQLLGGKSTGLGFYYDFFLKDPISKEMIPHLEERMHALVRQDLPIKKMEMVTSVGVGFLKHHKHFHRAKDVKESSNALIQIFQMGEMVDYCEEPFEENLCVAFKLQEIQNQSDFIRIKGTAFASEKELKKFLIFHKKNHHLEHMSLGQRLGFFQCDQESINWLPKGEALYHNLLQFLRKKYQEQGFEWVSFQGDPARFHENTKIDRFVINTWQDREEACDLIKTERALVNRAYIFCSRDNMQKSIISSLQFIEEIFKILGLKCRFVVSSCAEKIGKKVFEDAARTLNIDVIESSDLMPSLISIEGSDLYGRYWPVFEVKLSHGCIEMSAFKTLERLIGLLIESNQGILPIEILSKR